MNTASSRLARIAIDLNPSPLEARPQLERHHRALFWGLVLVITALFAGALTDTYSVRKAVLEIEMDKAEESAARAEITKLDQIISTAGQNRDRAVSMAKWVSTTLNMQPFVLEILKGAGTDGITVESLSVKLTEGQQQIEQVEIVYRGEQKTIIQEIDNMTKRLASAGFMMGSPDSLPADGGSGIRFKARFIFPAPNQVHWEK